MTPKEASQYWSEYPVEIHKLRRILAEYRYLEISFSGCSEVSFNVAIPHAVDIVTDFDNMPSDQESDVKLAFWNIRSGGHGIVSVHYPTFCVSASAWAECEFRNRNRSVVSSRTPRFSNDKRTEFLLYDRSSKSIEHAIVAPQDDKFFLFVLRCHESEYLFYKDEFQVAVDSFLPNHNGLPKGIESIKLERVGETAFQIDSYYSWKTIRREKNILILAAGSDLYAVARLFVSLFPISPDSIQTVRRQHSELLMSEGFIIWQELEYRALHSNDEYCTGPENQLVAIKNVEKFVDSSFVMMTVTCPLRSKNPIWNSIGSICLQLAADSIRVIAGK
jgi:hypothetical protein